MMPDMPQLADVRAAADRSKPPAIIDLSCPAAELVPQRMADLAVLRDFTLAVLDAPGISAERLAQIQSHDDDYQAGCELTCDSPADNFKCACCQSAEVAPKDRTLLLAEVLRLRAQQTA